MSEKKVKLRMGMHNRITKDRWQSIKDDYYNGLSVPIIAKRHAVSESTVRKVRRSRNFHEYRLSNDKRLREPFTEVMSSCGVAYIDFGKKPLFFSPKKVKSKNIALSNRLDREAENTARCLGIVMSGIVGIIVLALVIVFISSLVRNLQ